MTRLRITVKNYRCFSDTLPAQFEVGDGFIAFVGPNNSEESSILKFLHEFAPLWSQLAQPNIALQASLNPRVVSFDSQLRDVFDVEFLACDHTGRPLEIQVDIVSTISAPCLRGVRIVASDKRLHHTKTYLYDPTGMSPTANVDARLLWEDNKDVAGFDLLKSAALQLAGARYIPPFRNAINEGAGAHYGLAVGTAVIAQWQQWKTGGSRHQRQRIEAVTEDIRRLFRFETLEINASVDGKGFLVNVNKRPYRLEDQGSGLAQFIIVFANVALAPSSMLLIDEPELNLHPAMQREFLLSLASYTTARSVAFATHSIGLARTVADRIYSCQMTSEGAKMQSFETTTGYAEFLGELSFSTFRELGCNALLLVEGVNDVRAVQQWLRVLNKDHLAVAVPLGGDAMITPERLHELAEFGRLAKKVFVLVDSERSSPSAEIPEARAQFANECRKLGYEVLITERRALENYLSGAAIRSVFGEKYKCLGHFDTLESLAFGWAKSDNWRIAREMSKLDILDTDIGRFFDLIV